MADKKLEPTWIGIEIPTSNGTYRICVGLNLDTESGTEVSFCNDEDIKLGAKYGENPWTTDGDIVVKTGKDAMVFDVNHNLITK